MNKELIIEVARMSGIKIIAEAKIAVNSKTIGSLISGIAKEVSELKKRREACKAERESITRDALHWSRELERINEQYDEESDDVPASVMKKIEKISDELDVLVNDES